jgi:hypothetical protein
MHRATATTIHGGDLVRAQPWITTARRAVRAAGAVLCAFVSANPFSVRVGAGAVR